MAPILVPFEATVVKPDTPSDFNCHLLSNLSSTFSTIPMQQSISTPCSFDAENFEAVMLNLIRNPNITSSVVFRADILWDSATDSSFDPHAASSDILLSGDKPVQLSSFIKHMRAELRPRVMSVDGFRLRRTMVRQMIPRNTKLDKSLVQTCHFFSKRRPVRPSVREAPPEDEHVHADQDELEEDDNLVVYLPHVQNEAEMPFYHPKVKALCFLHSGSTQESKLSIHISPFPLSPSNPDSLRPNTTPSPSPPPPGDRLSRTLQKLLSTIHRHGNGLASGYQKRVHHDRLIPQARVQDTYTRLKNLYAKDLLDTYWQEQTDATKGIFEDLGIAAFCIELWGSMYQRPSSSTSNSVGGSAQEAKAAFPGFVDIGCGNGVLTFILLSEGYPGWGFDARARRTWAAFPPAIRGALHERILIPSIFGDTTYELTTTSTSRSTSPRSSASISIPETTPSATPPPPSLSTPHGPIPTHDGTFPPGTFIISNHADELTIWTPLLAYLSQSPFIAIPCCSHDLSGAKRRFPPPPAPAPAAVSTPSSPPAVGTNGGGVESADTASVNVKGSGTSKGAKPSPPPSAYATLCSAVSRLASSVGYAPEEEILRIPSTRNTAIVGRRWKVREEQAYAITNIDADADADADAGDKHGSQERGQIGCGQRREVREESEEREGWVDRENTVRRIVQQELGGRGIEEIGREWRERAARIAGSRGTRDVVGHG